ncbi:MAG: YigZ family protein [Marinifilaceae bacterium]|nr:YigZ family protein [Marinifilaceae bacterium]
MAEADKYNTIESTSEGLYKEKGSKFISYIYSISSLDQVKTIVTDLKKEYYDARHHCYAYSLGVEKPETRAVDDGEPSSTAGKPILGQIKSNNLSDVLIVVVRYFGGTKLGASGLIRAYKAAAADAIENSNIIEKKLQEKIEIQFPYKQMNRIMKIIKDFDLEIISTDFQIICNATVSVDKSDAPKFIDIFNKLDSVSAK